MYTNSLNSVVTVGGVGWSSTVLIEAGRNDRVVAQLKVRCGSFLQN